MYTFVKYIIVFGVLLGLSGFARHAAYAGEGRQLAAITTEWKAIGANHKVVIMAFQDPDISEITCYVSQAKTGGIKGTVGIAEDPSNFALSCVRMGTPTIKKELPKEVQIFTQGTSLWFKATRVYRVYDAQKKTVVYLALSRHLLDGSPMSAISAVPLQ